MSAYGYERTFPGARYYDRSQAVSRRSGRLRQLTGMEPTADDLLAAGDRDGQAAWIRVLRAVDGLLARDQPERASTH